MQTSSARIRVGTRGSPLARVQTGDAVARLGALLPEAAFAEVVCSSPGDRDRATDLRASPPDFFTRDLDDALRGGAIDCAIHSAKDVPDPAPPGLDWFWLPWREDPRDVLVLRPGVRPEDLPPQPVVGISSERRDAYCRRRFPGAAFRAIRGNIGERLAQLDAGQYDVLVMAAAALLRLGLRERIGEWIPAEDLPPPDGQGALGLTFRAGDPFFLRLRGLAVRAVTFAGGGAGRDSGTLAAVKALARCEVCLYDTLLDASLLEALPAGARRIDVGKRCASHGLPQAQITALLAAWARRGARVVRLKGGDPGVFGRLAEEVEALDALQLPYRVLPGVSSLSAATTGTGILLTRRGVSRGFCVMTPRQGGGGIGSVAARDRAALPTVFFMATAVAREVTAQLVADGQDPDTPAALVYSAGADDEEVVRGTLGDIAARAAGPTGDARAAADDAPGRPGLLIVGQAAAYGYRTDWGPLGDCRVLLTCSAALQDKAAASVCDAGGRPLQRPLIRLAPTDDARRHARSLDAFDWVVLTSPSAADCFLELLERAEVDLRRVPRLLVCGDGTARQLAAARLRADAQPSAGFSAAAVVEAARAAVAPGSRILRLRSAKAGPALAEALRALGHRVEDCVLYRNEPAPVAALPPFDAVFFASASAVEVFAGRWGTGAAAGKVVVALGQPTLAALRRHGLEANVVPPEATVEAAIAALARHRVRRALCPGTFKEIQP